MYVIMVIYALVDVAGHYIHVGTYGWAQTIVGADWLGISHRERRPG